MLVNMRDLLADAQNGNYAVGSFSVANMEMVLGVLKAAEELKAPVILQIAEVRLKQSPLEIIGPLMVAAAEAAQTPVAVHFDHGKTIEKISQALDLGFTSVTSITGAAGPLASFSLNAGWKGKCLPDKRVDAWLLMTGLRVLLWGDREGRERSGRSWNADFLRAR